MKKYLIFGFFVLIFGFIIVSCSQTTSTDTTTTTSSATTTTTANGATTTTTSTSSTSLTSTSLGTSTTTSSTTTTTFNHAAADWAVSTLVSAGTAGKECALVLDSNDKSHIVHFGSALMYTTNASGDWVTTTVDSSGSTTQLNSLSLAIDSDDGLHISYFNTSRHLRYAYKAAAGSSWTKTTVEEDVGSGGAMASAIAVDSSGEAHIIYRDIPNTRVRYATNSSGSWATQTVVTNTSASEFDIVIDSSDNIFAAYPESAASVSASLESATLNGASWTISPVASGGPLKGLSLAFDDSNKVHASYLKYKDSTNYNLIYANNSTGTFAFETTSLYLGSSSNNSSIALDNNNNVFISAYHKSTTYSSVKTAMKIADSWSTETVKQEGDEDSCGKYNSIAVDSIGRCHIAFYVGDGYDLLYAVEE